MREVARGWRRHLRVLRHPRDPNIFFRFDRHRLIGGGLGYRQRGDREQQRRHERREDKEAEEERGVDDAAAGAARLASAPGASVAHRQRRHEGEGGEQGDPLMPLLFALAVHDALAEVASQMEPDELLCAFLDDVYAVCEPGRVRQVFNMMQEALGRRAGIRLHLGKTRAWNKGGVKPDGLDDLADFSNQDGADNDGIDIDLDIDFPLHPRFDYIDGANGPNTAPNVDSILKYGEYDESGISAFLNSAETKRSSLNLPADATWRQSSSIVHEHLYEDIMKPYSALLEPVLAAGVPVLLYQGQLDVRDGVAATEAWLENWSWSGSRRFLDSPRKAWMSSGIAGYYRSCGGLTHLTVNAAGHLVPHDAPSQALDMIERFVAGAFEEQC